MFIFLAAFLPTLSSIFHSRAALELENLALWQQIGVLQRFVRKRAQVDSRRPPPLGLAVSGVERLALRAGYRSTLLAGFLRSKHLWPLRVEPPTLFSRFDRRYVPLGSLGLLDFPRLDNKGMTRLIHSRLLCIISLPQFFILVPRNTT